MKYDIVAYQNEFYSCHQTVLATYTTYLKREHFMIFAESWGFGYTESDYPFGQSVNLGQQIRREALLEKYHGVSVKEEAYQGRENAAELIKRVLPHSPVMLFCNVYDCPWNISYRRNHIKHFVLLTGFDDNDGTLNVLDPYSTAEENRIALGDLAPENGYIRYFIPHTTGIIKREDFLAEITKAINHIEECGFFDTYNYFLQSFRSRFAEVALCEYTDIYAIPLVINLRRVANQRQCFRIFLEKAHEIGLTDCSAADLMKSISDKYALLRIFLVKQIMKRKTDSQACSEIISDIIKLEREAYEKLKSYI